MVKDLFLSGTTTWDVNKIQSLIHEDDAEKILMIRPSITGLSDIRRWDLTNSRSNTVKIGYYLQQALDKEDQLNQVPTSSDFQMHHRMLTKFWI